MNFTQTYWFKGIVALLIIVASIIASAFGAKKIGFIQFGKGSIKLESLAKVENSDYKTTNNNYYQNHKDLNKVLGGVERLLKPSFDHYKKMVDTHLANLKAERAISQKLREKVVLKDKEYNALNLQLKRSREDIDSLNFVVTTRDKSIQLLKANLKTVKSDSATKVASLAAKVVRLEADLNSSAAALDKSQQVLKAQRVISEVLREKVASREGEANILTLSVQQKAKDVATLKSQLAQSSKTIKDLTTGHAQALRGKDKKIATQGQELRQVTKTLGSSATALRKSKKAVKAQRAIVKGLKRRVASQKRSIKSLNVRLAEKESAQDRDGLNQEAEDPQDSEDIAIEQRQLANEDPPIDSERDAEEIERLKREEYEENVRLAKLLPGERGSHAKSTATKIVILYKPEMLVCDDVDVCRVRALWGRRDSGLIGIKYSKKTRGFIVVYEECLTSSDACYKRKGVMAVMKNRLAGGYRAVRMRVNKKLPWRIWLPDYDPGTPYKIRWRGKRGYIEPE